MSTTALNKRLQVLVPEPRWRELRKIARSKGIPVGEWVRRVLEEACRREQSAFRVSEKIEAIEEAMQYRFPAPDIEQMNAEIEGGYLKDLPE